MSAEQNVTEVPVHAGIAGFGSTKASTARVAMSWTKMDSESRMGWVSVQKQPASAPQA